MHQTPFMKCFSFNLLTHRNEVVEGDFERMSHRKFSGKFYYERESLKKNYVILKKKVERKFRKNNKNLLKLKI